MDDESIPVEEALILGVNWVPDSSDEKDDYKPVRCSTLHSCPVALPLMDHEEDLADAGGDEKITMSESEVQFVPDSLAGDTEVPDSQLAMAEGDEQDEPDVIDDALLELASTIPDVVDALQELASTEVSKFQSDKERSKFSKLLLPIYLPRLYGDHERDVNDAAVDLVWIAEKVGV